MKFWPFQITVRDRAGTVDFTRSGWRQRWSDAIQVARGRMGVKTATGRMTPSMMADYYQLIPPVPLDQLVGWKMSWLQGNFTAAYDLTSVMLDTWPVCMKNQHECRSALRRIQFRALPWRAEFEDEPSPEAIDKAALWNAAMEKFCPTPGSDERGWGGTVYGLAGALVIPTIREVLYFRDEDGIWPYATAWVRPSSYGFVSEELPPLGIGTASRKVTRLAARIDQPSQIAPLTVMPRGEQRWLPSGDSLVGIYETRDGGCTTSGLVRPLLEYWGIMLYGRKWMFRNAELFGQPIRIAYVDSNADLATKSAVDAMMEDMGASGWARLPDNVRKVDLLQAGAVGSDNPQRHAMDRSDMYCNLVFYGETLTSTTGDAGASGTDRSAGVHRQTRTENDISRADWVAETIRHQIVRETQVRNFGDDKFLPLIKAEFPKEPDKTEEAAIISTWLQNYDLDAADAAEISNLPLKPKLQPAAISLPPAAEATDTVRAVGAIVLRGLSGIVRAFNENHDEHGLFCEDSEAGDGGDGGSGSTPHDDGGQGSDQPSGDEGTAKPKVRRLTIHEADQLLTEGCTAKSTVSGKTVRFGERLKAKLESKPGYVSRKELLEYGREAVRSGKHTPQDVDGQPRDYYTKAFHAGDRRLLVVVDAKDGEAFNLFQTDVAYLKNNRIRARRGARQGEQPPPGVMQAYVAADCLPDWFQYIASDANVNIARAASQVSDADQLAAAMRADLSPFIEKYSDLIQRLTAAAALADEPFRAEIEHLRPEIEAMIADKTVIAAVLRNSHASSLLEKLMGRAAVNAMAEVRAKRKTA